MQTPQIFKFEQNEVRTILVNDEPYFVGKDVANILGYKNGSRDINRHVDEEDRLKKKLPQYQNGTLVSETIIVNESGLYALVFGSKLSSAKKFKRWVTSEVLPAIRKRGMYATDELLDNPDLMIEAMNRLKEERTLRLVAEQRVAEYEPKINYLDSILSSQDTVTTSQIAADYGMSARAFNKLLHELGVQRKVSHQWLLYKKHMNQGYTKSETSNIRKSDGSYKTVMNTKWTQKGRLFIYELLKKEGLYPQMELEEAI